MIRNTYVATRFTQFFILCFRIITPLAFLYFGIILAVRGTPPARLPLYVEVYLATEICFYLLLYLPAHRKAQSVTTPAKKLSRDSRRDLFQRCLNTIPDAEHFVTRWTGAKALKNVGRGDLKDWLRWSMFDTVYTRAEGNDELESFVHSIENMLAPSKLVPGRSGIRSNKPSIDAVQILHRPLIYYLCGVAASDLASYAWMKWHGFDFYPLQKWFTSIPPRPQTLLCGERSSATHIAYWHRPHTSKTRMPILYIHGIGILHTYLKFFSDLSHHLEKLAGDGDVGILVLDIGPVSFRMTHDLPTANEFCEEVSGILAKHNYLQHRFLLVANSFGTAVSVQMLKFPTISVCIADVIWIDPCVFLLHLPETTSNFLRRQPESASEWQLWYFASRDIGVAHTLSRRFLWTDSIVWKEELESPVGIWNTQDDGQTKNTRMPPNGTSIQHRDESTNTANNVAQQQPRQRKWTIVLSEDDIIVDVLNVGKYLTRAPGLRAVDDKRTMTELKKSTTVFDYRRSVEGMPAKVDRVLDGESHLDVLWFEGLNHAETMDFRSTRRVLIDVVTRNSLLDS